MNSEVYLNYLKYIFHQGGDESESEEPWWRTSFFIKRKILFGTWDGVFTSSLLNTIGVVIFLRTGWMVGYAGIGLSLFIVAFSFLVAFITVMSAVGICDRCSVGKGGVYLILTHVLGGKIGGTIGILFCMGQAIATALYCIGFSESLAGLIRWNNTWAIPCIAIGTLLILLGITLSGVKWVIRFQLVLIMIIVTAFLDFIIGSIAQVKDDVGFTGYSTLNLRNNFKFEFNGDVSFFVVFGVFFPTTCGLLAGVNMSGDLKNPVRNIHKGSLTSLAVCCVLYSMIILILGSTCNRDALQKDFMIVEKVSQVGALFLFGLFVASLSSAMGGLVGPPRVLQRIAEDDVLHILKPFAIVHGDNKEPRNATLIIACLALMFIFIGKLNLLAPIVTMPFLTTFAIINYAYFAMAMSFDIKLKSFIKQKNINEQLNYGSLKNTSEGKTTDEPLPKIIDETYGDSVLPITKPCGTPDVVDTTEHTSTSPKERIKKEKRSKDSEEENDFSKLILKKERSEPSIRIVNRWVSLLACITCLVLPFCINWIYALCNFIVTFLLYFHIRYARPGLESGVSSDFHLGNWIISLFPRREDKQTKSDQLILLGSHKNSIPFGIAMHQVTEDNKDYEHRHKKHCSAVVNKSVPYNISEEKMN